MKRNNTSERLEALMHRLIARLSDDERASIEWVNVRYHYGKPYPKAAGKRYYWMNIHYRNMPKDKQDEYHVCLGSNGRDAEAFLRHWFRVKP